MKRAYRTSRSTRCRVCWGLAVLLFFSVTAGVSAAEPSAELSLKDQAEAYFSTHDYDGFYKYLSRLLADDPMNAGAHFYRALTRVEEIAYWQKIKDWQGVYDTAPAYQKGIAADLDAAEKYAGEDVTVRFGVALLRWRAANEARKEGAYALFDAVVAAAEKAASVPQGLAMVRDVADELRGFEDKNLSRRLDRIYVDNLGASGATSEELIRQADAFLKEDNLYLAKSLFEITLGRIGDDLVRARAMVAIADRFASSGSVPAADPVFAEELYVKAAALKGAEAFDNDSLYRRAFNLERLRDYAAALPVYKQWLAAYGAADPGRRADVLFRVGVLSAYGLRDRAAGERVLEELIKDFPATALAVAARYELGCMAQWSG
ncbi:MAG: tetratricopeptide repeat protein, partial [Deltaproteobacteria bacterium]